MNRRIFFLLISVFLVMSAPVSQCAQRGGNPGYPAAFPRWRPRAMSMLLECSCNDGTCNACIEAAIDTGAGAPIIVPDGGHEAYGIAEEAVQGCASCCAECCDPASCTDTCSCVSFFGCALFALIHGLS